MVLGDLDSYMQKNETRPLTYTTYHNKLIVDKKNLNVSSDTIKIRKKNIGHKFSHYSRSNIFTDISPRQGK